MKGMLMRFIVSVIVTVGVLLPVFSFAGEAEQKVRALEVARRSALVAGDEAGLKRIMASRMTYTHSNGLVQTREQLIHMLRDNKVAYLKFDVGEAHVVEFHSVVVVTGAQKIQLRFEGSEFASRSRYTVVYAETDGMWQVVAYQSTPLPDLIMEETQR
jgi:ketosteroid isomerase-like protein